jgi:hypothetical protein
MLPKLSENDWHEIRIWGWYMCIICAVVLLAKCHGDISVINH